MKQGLNNIPKNAGKKNISGARVLHTLFKTGAFFIILEPVWMLLPFAGFLYGSVMHIGVLSNNPYTSWLVHFVLPIHTLFPLGLILIFAGFSIFLAGAFQIYSAKLLKKGLVKTGIYRKFRHPQYLALTLFGIGILLTWGRFITFIAFFIMMWLYYVLSKSEEKKCFELFGEEFEEYRSKTCFLFPGEKAFFAITDKLLLFNLAKGAGIITSFLAVVSLSIGIGFLIKEIRAEFRNTLPVIEGTLELSDNIRKVKFLMIKGPVLQAAPVEKIRTQYMEKIFAMVTSSSKIKQALNQLNIEEDNTLLVFLTPGSNWYSGAHRDYSRAKVNAYVVNMKTPVQFTGNNFRKFRDNWQITHLIRAEDMSYGRMESGQDPVEGGVAVEEPQGREGERIKFFLSGLKG